MPAAMFARHGIIRVVVLTATALVGVSTAHAQSPRLFLVPQGGDEVAAQPGVPEEVSAAPGELIVLNVFIEDESGTPPTVRAVQTVVDCNATPDVAAFGTIASLLIVADIGNPDACSADGDPACGAEGEVACQEVCFPDGGLLCPLGVTCTQDDPLLPGTCDGGGGSCAGTPAIDVSHPDYLFPADRIVAVGDARCDPNPRLATALFAGGVVVGGTPKYVGTVLYQASIDADGSFTIDILPGAGGSAVLDPNSDDVPGLTTDGVIVNVGIPACATVADCADDMNACTYNACAAGVCTYEAPCGGYGDISNNCTVDLDDLFCMFDGFSGDFSACPFANINIHPCGDDADPDINLDDLFALFGAFGGEDPCCGG